MNCSETVELWDAYDCNANKLDGKLIRGEKIPEGMYHLVAEIIVRHKDGSFLAMQRDFCKKHYGGFWEISAGGAVKKGETALEGAVRELFEETGLVCKNLEKTYRICGKKYPCIYFGYICIVDCDKNRIKLQEGETVAYKWVKSEDIIRFLTDKNYVTIHAERVLPYIHSLIDKSESDFDCLIGCTVNVKVDRPLGSVHPKHSDIVYKLNYGYIEGVIAPDGEEQDAYIVGVDTPLEEFTGKIIAIIHRKNDIENKWVVAPENKDFSKAEIERLIHFQEQYFDIEIIT